MREICCALAYRASAPEAQALSLPRREKESLTTQLMFLAGQARWYFSGPLYEILI